LASSGATKSARSREGGLPFRDLGRAWLHLAVLWTFAFAQPLFDVLADSPEFFVARRNTAADIVVLAVALVAVPPSLLVLVEAALVRLPRARRALHLVLVGLLAAAIALQLLTDLLGGAALPILLAAGLGAAAAVAYARVEAIPTALTVLSPIPLALVLYFLLLSPASDLVLAGSQEAAEGAAGGNGAPVVMVVFDEFPTTTLLDEDGEIDRSRFPNFARLADESTWYRNATTVADRTTIAVPAILTGRVPAADDLPIAAEHPDSLFSLLGDRYAFLVEEPATDLCPEQLCGEEERPGMASRLESLVSDLSVVSLHVLLPEDLAEDLPPVDRSFGDFRNRGLDPTDRQGGSANDLPVGAIENRAELFDRFVRDLDAGARRPALHFLHVGLPHQPWEYLPDGTQYRVPRERPPGERLVDEPAPARQMLQQHALQTVYLDRLIGRLLRRMHDLGLDRRAALVVTADHGISFRPDDESRSVTETNIAAIAGVPLFVKAPGQREGRVDDSPARTVDILPTLASQLDLEPSWRTGGCPLDGGGAPARDAVDVKTLFDETRSVPFAQFVAARDAIASESASAFGPGVDGLLEPPTGRELVGRQVGSMRILRAGGGSVEVDSPSQFAQVVPDGPVLPIGVSGRLSGVADDTRLAIALNGRIAALTGAYADRGDVVFAALVPPSALRPGENAVTVFALRGDDGEPALVELRQREQLNYRLAEEDGGTVLEGPGADTIAVQDDAAEGYVEAVRAGATGPVVVTGWAVAGEDRVDRVVVFAGDRFVGSTTTSQERPDVAQARGGGPLKTGFTLSASETGVDQDELRVFAVAAGAASQLPLLESP
jgi:Sulfatase